VTNELRAYPQDMLTAPNERTAQLSWTTGAVPADAVALRRAVAQSRDQRGIDRSAGGDPKVALLGLLVAAALHAFSPGHGKTVVGAYVGSRGTPRHAAFR